MCSYVPENNNRKAATKLKLLLLTCRRVTLEAVLLSPHSDMEGAPTRTVTGNGADFIQPLADQLNYSYKRILLDRVTLLYGGDEGWERKSRVRVL